jgi:hypothetical protein
MRFFLIILIASFSFQGFSQSLRELKLKKNQINQFDSNGKKNGLWFVYTQKSEIVEAHSFKEGKKMGRFEIYHLNGNIEQKGFYHDDKLDSTLLVFDESGKLISRSSYKKGEIDGLAFYYDKKGNVTSQQRYVEGILDSNYLESYEDPTIVSDGFFVKLESRYDTVQAANLDIKNSTGYTVYRNDSIIYEVIKVGNNKLFENFFNNRVVTKRIFYKKKKPFTVRKIVHYKDGAFPKIEIFDDNGEIVEP